MTTLVATTGHRPKSFPGLAHMPEDDVHERLRDFAKLALPRILGPLLGDLMMITGMAEGWDLAVADACNDLGIPYLAALPFEGQERYWSGRSQARSQARYRTLRALAAREHIVFPFRDRSAYLRRDEWMVDSGEMLVGICGKEDGGSAYTFAYANRWCVHNVNLWNMWVGVN